MLAVPQWDFPVLTVTVSPLSWESVWRTSLCSKKHMEECVFELTFAYANWRSAIEVYSCVRNECKLIKYTHGFSRTHSHALTHVCVFCVLCGFFFSWEAPSMWQALSLSGFLSLQSASQSPFPALCKLWWAATQRTWTVWSPELKMNEGPNIWHLWKCTWSTSK